MEEVDELELLVERVAGLDVGKAELVACVRVPHPSKPGRRMQEVRAYATTTAELVAIAVWLRQHRVQRVVMESTGDYWKGIYYLLEAERLDCWLVNARDVKNLPGRAKTDTLDSIWLAKVAERGMCSPSLVHPEPIRRLRDLTRYRRALVADRGREMQRAEKLLEDAQIKLSVVASDIFGVSGRDMMAALVAGERDPKVLAQMARASMRRKIARLEEAFTGYFTDHHAFLLSTMPARVDAITADINRFDDKIEELITPFAHAVEQLG